MTDKEKEIKLLTQLMELDGYFADYFKKDLDQMVRNIKDDHPIEFDTEFYKKPAALEEQNKQLIIRHKAKVSSICETLLCVQENGNQDNRLKERAVQEIGLPEVIRLKHVMGLEWDVEDKEYLVERLAYGQF